MASFGEELKRERELRDISLKEISEATKISIRFLEALEQNNFDVLPGGVFNRGFIRAYARFIGVDGEEMVNAYLHEVALREARQTQSGKGPQRPAGPAVASKEAPPAARLEARAPQRIESRHTGRGEARAEIPPETGFARRATHPANEGRTSMALWVLVVLAFLVGVGVITMSFMSGKQVDASAEGHAQALKARLSKKEAGPPTPIDTNAPAPGPAAQVTQPEASAPSQEPAGTPATAVKPSDQTASATGPGMETQPPANPEHRLRVRVLEATRVTVECAGKLSLDQELWPGQSRTLACGEPVVLSAGNGGAVEYTIDDGSPALLGGVGQQIEALTVAPVAPAPPPKPAGQADKDPHAGR